MKSFFCLIACILLAQSASADLWYTITKRGASLYQTYLNAGVPEDALRRTFNFLRWSNDKELSIRTDDGQWVDKEVTNKNYAVIIDYSRPSSEKRLFLLNLNTGAVYRYYVAHGLNSGENDAESFSNIPDSKKTSLGFYLTGSEYFGTHGNSIHLYGLERSNDRAFERTIVMHGAPYVSTQFLDKYGRMGRSWGCPAVSKETIQQLIPVIKNGTVVYAYHKDLMAMAQTSPAIQNVSDDQTKTSNNGNHVVPEEIDP